jgi:hypothetical protein
VNGAPHTIIPIRLAEEIQQEWIHVMNIAASTQSKSLTELCMLQNGDRMYFVPLCIHHCNDDGNGGVWGMTTGPAEPGTTGTSEGFDDGRETVLFSRFFLEEQRVEDMRNAFFDSCRSQAVHDNYEHKRSSHCYSTCYLSSSISSNNNHNDKAIKIAFKFICILEEV